MKLKVLEVVGVLYFVVLLDRVLKEELDIDSVCVVDKGVIFVI